MDPSALLPFVQERSVSLMISLVSAAAFIAAVDYVFTRQSYMNKLKMSRREIKEEMRQSEGDPLVKAKLRQIRFERSKRRMMASVPQASVIITNPTHYAIALRYEQGETPAPMCLAKGVDAVAQRIREVAEEHNIPIVENPPLARALLRDRRYRSTHSAGTLRSGRQGHRLRHENGAPARPATAYAARKSVVRRQWLTDCRRLAYFGARIGVKESFDD